MPFSNTCVCTYKLYKKMQALSDHFRLVPFATKLTKMHTFYEDYFVKSVTIVLNY